MNFTTRLGYIGDYAYDQPPPWKRLVEDPKAATVTPQEVEAASREHLPTLLERARVRESLSPNPPLKPSS